MIVLGISGFEDASFTTDTHPYTGQAPPDAPFTFRHGTVPLQYFPLGLIGHDAAAAILVDGRLVACVAEERFTRHKHGFNLAGRTLLPRRAIRYCLEEVGCTWADVDVVAHYCRFTPEAVAARLERVGAALEPALHALLEREYTDAYAHRLAPEVLHGQLETIAERPIPPGRVVSVPHHVAHAAGAFYSSGFDNALCLTLDGYGEEESALWAIGTDAGLTPHGQLYLPSSLGTLYQLVTAYLGFRTFGDEYKTMGLAAYGDPERFDAVVGELVTLGPDGTWSTAGMSRPDLYEWLRARLGPVEEPGACSRRSADVAAALQRALERAVLHMLRDLRTRFPLDRLCVAGGVGLNACMNGAIVRSGLFRRLYVQPAASDDGAALGAALYAHHALAGGTAREPIAHTYWGPEYCEPCIEEALETTDGLVWERTDAVETRTARLLADGAIVGWYQGRMEMGPRALGARSILATPSSVEVRDRINALVKGREPFRPFAPSVLSEDASMFFDIPDDTAAPFMVVTYPAREAVRQRLAGVVHVDGSARVHVVHETHHPRYHRLLREFGALTGVPVLLNTSFNRAREPIVCTPADAVACFLRGGLDALAIGDYLVRRRDGRAGSDA
jgi:carbamoyltransferase